MDLLVRLYDLPSFEAAENVNVRRAFAAEKELLRDWISARFGRAWASECEASFARQPVACFIATADAEVIGFACYDATARGLFGPTGVDESARKHGVGGALLLATLHDMAAQGYAYAVIGDVSSAGFYRKHLDVTEIAGSTPGFYRDLLRYRTKST